jgi:hypothetical protein
VLRALDAKHTDPGSAWAASNCLLCLHPKTAGSIQYCCVSLLLMITV